MKQIEALYRLYKQDVYVYLFSLTRNPTLSEDLLAETFVRAIGSISQFKNQSSVKTWLFSIARHMWLHSLRNEKSTIQYNDLLELYVSDCIVERLVTTETAKLIRELILEKDERTQMIFNMRISGYSYSEIADKVGVTESSARVIDYRTKKWIKTILEKEEQQ